MVNETLQLMSHVLLKSKEKGIEQLRLRGQFHLEFIEKMRAKNALISSDLSLYEKYL